MRSKFRRKNKCLGDRKVRPYGTQGINVDGKATLIRNAIKSSLIQTYYRIDILSGLLRILNQATHLSAGQRRSSLGQDPTILFSYSCRALKNRLIIGSYCRCQRVPTDSVQERKIGRREGIRYAASAEGKKRVIACRSSPISIIARRRRVEASQVRISAIDGKV